MGREGLKMSDNKFYIQEFEKVTTSAISGIFIDDLTFVLLDFHLIRLRNV